VTDEGRGSGVVGRAGSSAAPRSGARHAAPRVAGVGAQAGVAVGARCGQLPPLRRGRASRHPPGLRIAGPRPARRAGARARRGPPHGDGRRRPTPPPAPRSTPNTAPAFPRHTAVAAGGGGTGKKCPEKPLCGDKFEYDLIIIGAGVGGHGAALHAVECGMKVAIIEGHDVGGTCVNRGCVPSKALLAASGRVREMRDAAHLASLGIQLGSVSFDRQKIAAHAADLVTNIQGNLQRSLEALGVDILTGVGKLTGPHTVSYALPGRVDVGGTVTGRDVMIATGSVPFVPPGVPIDGKTVFTSDHALKLDWIPKVGRGGGGVPRRGTGCLRGASRGCPPPRTAPGAPRPRPPPSPSGSPSSGRATSASSSRTCTRPSGRRSRSLRRWTT